MKPVWPTCTCAEITAGFWQSLLKRGQEIRISISSHFLSYPFHAVAGLDYDVRTAMSLLKQSMYCNEATTKRWINSMKKNQVKTRYSIHVRLVSQDTMKRKNDQNKQWTGSKATRKKIKCRFPTSTTYEPPVRQTSKKFTQSNRRLEHSRPHCNAILNPPLFLKC